MGKVSKAIETAGDCYKAIEVTESCALGASGDVYTVGEAIKVCEKDFSAKLTKSNRAIYSSLNRQCGKKYEKEEGTMYRSAAAFCSLGVTRLFYQLNTPVQ
jgi:hypothetical protein